MTLNPNESIIYTGKGYQILHRKPANELYIDSIDYHAGKEEIPPKVIKEMYKHCEHLEDSNDPIQQETGSILKTGMCFCFGLITGLVFHFILKKRNNNICLQN